MPANMVVLGTVGQKGVGKSYRRGSHWVINEFLVDTEAILYTTIPIFPGKIAEECVMRYGKDEAHWLRRLKIIPQDEVKAWVSGDKHPMDYLHTIANGEQIHVQFDEVHNYGGDKHPAKWRQKFATVIGEIRHMNMTLEFISQHWMKVAPEIKRETDRKLYLNSLEDERDPYFKIPMGHWWELYAGFISGKYIPLIAEDHFREKSERMQRNDRVLFRRTPYYYQFYDSYSAPLQGGDKGSPPKNEFERRSKIGLLLWFFYAHPIRICSRVLIVWLLVYLLFYGGISKGINSMVTGIRGGTDQISEGFKGDTSEPEVVVPDVISGGEPISEKTTKPIVSSTQVSDSDDEAVLIETAVADASELIVLRREHAESQAELLVLRDQLAVLSESVALHEAAAAHLSAVVMFEPDHVTLATGQRLAVGERVDWGPYEGALVESIDYRGRTCYLDSGAVLRSSALVE